MSTVNARASFPRYRTVTGFAFSYLKINTLITRIWLRRSSPYLGFQTSFFDAHQTKRRIADFQALQFRIADIATSLETARSMCFNAANDAPQLFGGYGDLADGIEKLVRDLRVHQILEDTNEIMRVVVPRGLFEN
jgi:alkylation response protein AidB-like acyl-CoA dehydrogenase